MDLSLHNRRALVCGSTQGIGRASALMMAECGADIVLMARNPESLETVRHEVSGFGVSCDVVVADFSDPSQVAERIDTYTSSHAGFDILVNNTGGPPAGPIASASVDDFLKAFNSHLINNHILVQATLPGMKERSFGRIVNIVSTSVREPIPGIGVSNTTRGAVASWAKTLSKEVAPFGITVNNVLPGATQTGRIDALIKSKAAKSGKSEDQVEQDLVSAIPVGRFAGPFEIAAAVVFLSSDHAAYITGVSLPVDGGRLNSI
ncbi:MAG: SDR family oxidoreductase [Rhodothermales bacterium]|nr:SDR family oxidoreductase [Rhodothermales bacterium]